MAVAGQGTSLSPGAIDWKVDGDDLRSVKPECTPICHGSNTMKTIRDADIQLIGDVAAMLKAKKQPELVLYAGVFSEFVSTLERLDNMLDLPLSENDWREARSCVRGLWNIIGQNRVEDPQMIVTKVLDGRVVKEPLIVSDLDL